MSKARDVEEIIQSIRPLLAGHPPAIQGTVLADLLATYLAGHTALNDAAGTDALRERLLAFHIDMVRKLVPVCEAEMAERRNGS